MCLRQEIKRERRKEEGRRETNGLEDGAVGAKVSRGRETKTSNQACAEIRDDVSVKVGENHDVQT